jgi:hypothetical protein
MRCIVKSSVASPPLPLSQPNPSSAIKRIASDGVFLIGSVPYVKMIAHGSAQRGWSRVRFNNYNHIRKIIAVIETFLLCQLT